MSISVQIHDTNPRALADVIAATMHDGVVMDPEPTVAHLAFLVHAEEQDAKRRRAAWHWLNSISGIIDRDNDWSDV